MLHQLIVRAGLGDAAIFNHNNAIGTAYGGKTMRDHEDRASAHQIMQGGLYQRFGLAVQRRSRLVQNKNWSILQQRPRNGQRAGVRPRRAARRALR